MPLKHKTRDFFRQFNVVGQKPIYLPDFVITLLRTPKLPPQYAKFKVPLNITKLDLKDYLYHVYNIKAQHIRSSVVQMRIRDHTPGVTLSTQREWSRPASEKYMTVHLDRPFVWPAEPDDYAPWSRDMYESTNNMREDENKKRMPDANSYQPSDTNALREHAKRLLSGEERWRPGAEDVRAFTRLMVGKRGKKKGVASIQEFLP